MNNSVHIAPSFLPAANFSALGDELRALADAGADMIHLDVIDGVFAPNLTFGPPVIASLRPLTSLPFDAHLMIEDPARLLSAFIHAGCDTITVHPEACIDVATTIKTIKAAGKRAGLALNPDTPLSVLDPYLATIDLILVMTVQAGFGGQAFIPLHDRIRAVAQKIKASGRAIDLEVDGGLNADNAPSVIAAGANILVSGTAVFQGGPDHYAANINALRRPNHAA
jgi:ribulose-phosphate 3-epimerase